MGGASGYLYLYCLCGAAVLALFGIGAALTWWGRRRERRRAPGSAGRPKGDPG